MRDRRERDEHRERRERGGRAERRERRKGRVARLGARARSRPWAVLVIVSIFPVAVSAFVIHGYRTGKLRFMEGSERVVPGVVILVILLVALVFLSWIAAPLLMPAVQAVRGFIGRQSHEIARGGVGSLFIRFPALVVGLILYAVLWVNVVALGGLIIANVLGIVACVALFVRDVLSVRG